MKSSDSNFSPQVAPKQMVPVTDQGIGLASACLGTKTPLRLGDIGGIRRVDKYDTHN